jgi:hypothetical protein
MQTENRFIQFATAGDVNNNSSSLANNQAVAADITGLVFSSSVTSSFTATGDVYIDATTDLYERFTLEAQYNGTDWDYFITSTQQDSEVVLSVTSGGQVQYTSGTYTGFVSATAKFRALAIV